MKSEVCYLKVTTVVFFLGFFSAMNDEAQAVGIWGQVNITLPASSTTPSTLPIDYSNLDEHPKTEPLVPPPPHFIPSSSHVPLKRKRPLADPATTFMPTSTTTSSSMTPVGDPTLLTRTWNKYIIANGTSYTLECAFEHLGNASVTWSRNGEIMAIDRRILTDDPRIYPLHEVGSPHHDLRISKLRTNDSAIYKCETNSDPPLAAEIQLIVIETYSVIFGAPEVRVRKGETLYLLCLVLEVVDIPEFMIWYQDGLVVDYSREDVTVTVDDLTCSSELQVRNVSEKDVGVYTCAPSNAPPAGVKVSLIKLGSVGPVRSTGKCAECYLYFQLGATIIFFIVSMIAAMCHHKRTMSDHPYDDDEFDFSYDYGFE